MDRTCTNLSYLLLMQTSKAIQERMRLELAKYKLSITEFSVLEVLYHKGRQTIQHIGNRLLITSGSMTYVIDKLEQRDFLYRTACPEDRRVIHVCLTDRGNEWMGKIMPKYREMVDNMFGSLKNDEADLLVRLLKNVKNQVEGSFFYSNILKSR